MKILRIVGEPDKIIESLFSVNDDGIISFGLTARSCQPATMQQLENDEVKFREYLMEGGVTFNLRLLRLSKAIQLNIKLAGTNRDQYIAPQIKFYIKQAGYEATDISNA